MAQMVRCKFGLFSLRIINRKVPHITLPTNLQRLCFHTSQIFDGKLILTIITWTLHQLESEVMFQILHTCRNNLLFRVNNYLNFHFAVEYLILQSIFFSNFPLFFSLISYFGYAIENRRIGKLYGSCQKLIF